MYLKGFIMQLKLLNIHKLLANFATNLVGAFIPIIVFEATGSMFLGVLTYLLQYLIRMLVTIILRKQFETKPQLMLMFGAIPILMYSIFVIVINYNLWVGVVGVIIFNGVNSAFTAMPREYILNYASLNNNNEESSLGFTRFIEQVGVFISYLVGGYLLGINKIIVVAISIAIYLASVVPLVMFYNKSKTEKTFNSDAVSNAQLTFKANNTEKYNYGKVLSKKLILIYGVTYFIYCFFDAFLKLFNIHLFATTDSYAIAGVFNAIYNASYGVGCYVFGKIAEKKDILIHVIVCLVVMGVSVLCISFIDSLWLRYVLFGVLGFAYSPVPLFNFQRLITKSRILGKSNTALYVREQSSNISVIVACSAGLFGTIVPCFILIASTLFASAGIIPYHEEKSRRLLVDYLQFNEITSKRRRGR